MAPFFNLKASPFQLCLQQLCSQKMQSVRLPYLRLLLLFSFHFMLFKLLASIFLLMLSFFFPLLLKFDDEFSLFLVLVLVPFSLVEVPISFLMGFLLGFQPPKLFSFFPFCLFDHGPQLLSFY